MFFVTLKTLTMHSIPWWELTEFNLNIWRAKSLCFSWTCFQLVLRPAASEKAEKHPSSVIFPCCFRLSWLLSYLSLITTQTLHRLKSLNLLVHAGLLPLLRGSCSLFPTTFWLEEVSINPSPHILKKKKKRQLEVVLYFCTSDSTGTFPFLI